MTGSPGIDAPIYSTLTEDADLSEIVATFVGEMPDRVSSLLERLEAADWEGLRRAAHQLTGAAGSHGFDLISHAAARVEETIRESRSEAEIRQSANVLVGLCRRARAVAPA